MSKQAKKQQRDQASNQLSKEPNYQEATKQTSTLSTRFLVSQGPFHEDCSLKNKVCQENEGYGKCPQLSLSNISRMLGVLLVGRGEFQLQSLAQKPCLLLIILASFGPLSALKKKFPKVTWNFPFLGGLGRIWGQEERSCLTGVPDTDQHGLPIQVVGCLY